MGILGLGVGGIAAYAQPGERFTFYEIDPAVERIARNPDYFSFLTDCRGKVDVILGDARLSLKYGPQRNYDLLILNVFSSDAVPVHLITREAFEIYRKRLNPGGILVVHMSSRYFNLEPVLGNLARAAGLTARLWRDNETEVHLGKFASAWVVMGEGPAALGALVADRRWQPLACDAGPVWTDDFSNVAGTLQWHSSGLHLIPAKWNKLNPAEAHALLAMALLDEARYDEAIEHFKESLAIDPDNAPNHYGLGVVLAKQGRMPEAIEHYKAALSLDANLPGAHSDLGVALDRTGEKDEALEHFRQAVEIAPDYVDGLHNLGKALLDRRQYDEGEDCFRKAVALKPGTREDPLRPGPGLARQESQAKVDEALGEFRRALPLAMEEDAKLVELIKAEIRRCEKWPWGEEKK